MHCKTSEMALVDRPGLLLVHSRHPHLCSVGDSSMICTVDQLFLAGLFVLEHRAPLIFLPQARVHGF